MIHFTKYAEEKFKILKEHKFEVSKDEIIKTVNNPNLIDRSRPSLLIAQKKISATHVLRVVYKKENNNKVIITFYPGRVKQYEK